MARLHTGTICTCSALYSFPLYSWLFDGTSTHLKSSDGCALEAEICLEVLRDFAHQALEWQLSDEQFGGFLVAPNFSEGHGSRAVPMRLFDATGRGGALASRLGRQLLARSFSTSRLTRCLLCTSHFQSEKRNEPRLYFLVTRVCVAQCESARRPFIALKNYWVQISQTQTSRKCDRLVATMHSAVFRTRTRGAGGGGRGTCSRFWPTRTIRQIFENIWALKFCVDNDWARFETFVSKLAQSVSPVVNCTTWKPRTSGDLQLLSQHKLKLVFLFGPCWRRKVPADMNTKKSGKQRAHQLDASTMIMQRKWS